MTERTNAQAPTVRGFWCDTPGFRKLLNDLRDGDGTVEEAAVTRFWNGILSRLFPYDGSERETFFVGPEAYVNPNTQERVDLLVVRITVNNEEIPIFAVEVKGTTPRSDGAWKDPYEQLRRYLTGLKLKYPQLREMYGAVAAGRECRFWRMTSVGIEPVRSTSTSQNKGLDMAEDSPWIVEHLNKVVALGHS